MNLEELREKINNYAEFEYNGYVVTKLEPESNHMLLYGPIETYRIYNRYSSNGDYDVVESKEDVVDYVSKENKYKKYYNRLNELENGVDFDYTYDLYKYLKDWIENYFGHRRMDVQIKYNDGKLSKMCRKVYLDIDDYGIISMESEDSKQYIEIEPMSVGIKILMVRFRRRILGSIKVEFPINFIGSFKSIYDIWEFKCKHRWWACGMEEELKKAYDSGCISEEQYNKLVKLMVERN